MAAQSADTKEAVRLLGALEAGVRASIQKLGPDHPVSIKAQRTLDKLDGYALRIQARRVSARQPPPPAKAPAAAPTPSASKESKGAAVRTWPNPAVMRSTLQELMDTYPVSDFGLYGRTLVVPSFGQQDRPLGELGLGAGGEQIVKETQAGDLFTLGLTLSGLDGFAHGPVMSEAESRRYLAAVGNPQLSQHETDVLFSGARAGLLAGAVLRESMAKKLTNPEEGTGVMPLVTNQRKGAGLVLHLYGLPGEPEFPLTRDGYESAIRAVRDMAGILPQ